MIQNAYELLAELKSKNLLEHTQDEFWWPKSGIYEVIGYSSIWYSYDG